MDAPLDRLLSEAGAALARVRQRAAAEHGLPATALAALEALDHADGDSHRELAVRLGVVPASLTPAVDVLEAQGRIRRDRDPADRRIVRLRITEAGRRDGRAIAREVAAALARTVPRPPDEAGLRRWLAAVVAAARPLP